MKTNRKKQHSWVSAERLLSAMMAMFLGLSLTASIVFDGSNAVAQSKRKSTGNAKTQGKRRPGALVLHSYEFDTVTVNAKGAITRRRKGRARSYIQNINGVGLEMVAIPGGSFTMGSTKYDDEKPRHQVKVPAFYLGKFEVTQAEWRAVTKLPKVSLDLNPHPSRFKGDKLPVEQVSWEEAIEFCARLSQATGRTYRLPTEAEWEYADRGGTRTPYAFGNAITTELANYNGGNPNGSAPKGVYRGKTTPVGSLGVANGFGLYDMDGNVSEWCLDHWHDSYDGAPTDGSAWRIGDDAQYRVARGNSWFHEGDVSRSASRGRNDPADRLNNLGLRVVAAKAEPIKPKSEATPIVASATPPTGPGGLPLVGFEFDTVTVNAKGATIKRRKGQARYYAEDLNGVGLEMVAIPGGTFTMGSSDFQDSSPMHQVSMAAFYMGKYEVTQAQWRAVARLPKVNRDLNPEASYFKGDKLPMERVSWNDAMEFCARLSQATGRTYRLPTEAEWEYACRGGTSTAFAYGETVTTEWVNYRGDYPYASAPVGVFRDKTTPVGSLGVANGFGLYDMHGNVWEWCLDYWHNDYEDAPADGSDWELDAYTAFRVDRGGSYQDQAIYCRSACRERDAPEHSRPSLGFRVAGGAEPPKLKPEARPTAAEAKPTVPDGTLATVPGGLPLVGYEFETVTVNAKGEIASRRKGQARYYVQDINGVGLEMVQIPSGSFTMGSSVYIEEQPRHQVNVPGFYIGKFEVTQAEWRAVTKLPKVSLDLRPHPSDFKGDKLPVQGVSWEEAMEFCARLSKATGATYRLPSEAEWEYACRAGTTTEFAFGETVTPELVNYRGGDPYDSAPKGLNRQRPTPVGSLGVANGFGLYDMHGNVREWCLDYWHESYNGAPTDGSAWVRGGDTRSRVVRNGSWNDIAYVSRSAYRNKITPGYWGGGFRVVGVARTH